MEISKKYKSKLPYLFITFGIMGVLFTIYFASLYLSPTATTPNIITRSSIDINKEDDETYQRDRIVIDKIGVEIPIYSGDASVLERGVWHRKPENGSPLDGGNFVLAAHRFNLGLTPSQTRQKSPFYNIDKLQKGDIIKIYYKGQWYSYLVNRKYSVEPTALYIENKTEKPILTLYSCTLQGSADGRDVIEALPMN